MDSLEHFVDPLLCGPVRSSLTTHKIRLVIHQVMRADVTVLKLIWLFPCYRERRQVALRIQKKCNVPVLCPPSALCSVLAVFVFQGVFTL